MKYKINIISEEIFTYSLITYLLLSLAETVKEGFVSYFVPYQWLLAIVLLSGVLMFMTPRPKELPKNIHSKPGLSLQIVFIFAVICGLLVYYKTQLLGNISMLAAFVTFIIIFSLSTALFSNDT